jgi:hypothetical protein
MRPEGCDTPSPFETAPSGFLQGGGLGYAFETGFSAHLSCANMG